MLLEPAYLLHRIPYRNTSLIGYFFTLNHGLIHAVIRGARREKSPFQGLTEPFSPLEIAWYGRGELVTLTKMEPTGLYRRLTGEALFYGLYLNELLMRLWKNPVPDLDLYSAYEVMLDHLQNGEPQERALRIFEKRLLQALGYDLQLTHEFNTNEPLDPSSWYHFAPDRNPERVEWSEGIGASVFRGSSLIALEQENFSQDSLPDAKHILRTALARLLGDKPLKSRDLFLYT